MQLGNRRTAAEAGGQNEPRRTTLAVDSASFVERVQKLLGVRTHGGQSAWRDLPLIASRQRAMSSAPFFIGTADPDDRQACR